MMRRLATAACTFAAMVGCAVPVPTPGSAAPDVRLTGAAGELAARIGDRRTGLEAASPFVKNAPGGPAGEVVPAEVVVGLAVGAAPPTDLGALGTAVVKDTVAFTRRYALLGLPPGAGIDAALEYLAGLPGVVSASPNAKIAYRAAPANDPLLPSQWAFEPNVADVYGAWAVLDALPNLSTRLDDTVVAIVDSGVDPGHPDLNVIAGHTSANSLTGGQNVPVLFFNPNGSDHGYGCAGVVGARKNNAVGAAGVVPGAPILSVILEDAKGDGGSLFSILRGLMIAAYYNRPDSPYPNLIGRPGGKVRVINLSVGPTYVGRQEPFDSAMEFLRQRGIVVAVAAGNNGLDGRVEVPANSPAAMGVSASMQYLGFELLAPYSSHGPEIWVAGPGNFIWTPASKENDATYDNAYRLFNGTSSAAPFVAGVAAAINVAYGSGGADQDTAAWADKVKRRIADTADDLGSPGFDGLFGHGRVNARKAVSGTL